MEYIQYCCLGASSIMLNSLNLVDIPGSNSYRLNPVLSGEVSELVEGARLETVYGFCHRGFESLPLRHCWKVTGSLIQGGPLLPSTAARIYPVH